MSINRVKYSYDRIQNIFFGLASLIGTGLTIFTLFNLEKGEPDNLKVIESLLGVILVLILTFVLSSFHYHKRLTSASNLTSRNEFLENKVIESEIIARSISEYQFNVSYFQVKLLYKLENFIQYIQPIIEDHSLIDDLNDEFLKKEYKNMTKDKMIDYISKEFYHQLSILTSNIESYYTLVTGDKCSVTLKLIKETNGIINVKTLYRDPHSYSKRKVNDYKNGSPQIYVASDNTAFDVIVNPSKPEVVFVNDDLNSLKEKTLYNNNNQNWNKQYFATLVVPITDSYDKRGNNLLGFLTVDNFRGKLNSDSNVNFLSLCGNLFYPIIDKFHKISNFANSKNLNNECTDRFTYWG